MPALDINNPKIIRFLLESYEKESRIRMKWIQLNSGQFENASKLTRKENNYTIEDITKTVMEAGMTTASWDHIATARYRNSAPLPDSLLVKVGLVKETVPSMKPVSSEEKDMLRKNRQEYLKKRSLVKPEEKYKFVECSNWIYGWRLGDSGIRMSGPEYGQVHHLLRNLRSRVGPQRDPEHYYNPETVDRLFVTL